MSTAKFDLVGEVRRSYAEETGAPITRGTASVIVDQMCDAFVHQAEGAGIDYAVAAQPDVARYLAYRWKGDDGRKLRAAIAARP